MSKRIQVNGKKVIEAEGGLVWSRNSTLGHYERGNYEAELLGVHYKLEKRYLPVFGWYLSTLNAQNGFRAEWCGSHLIMEAVDVATAKIDYQNSTRTERRSS